MDVTARSSGTVGNFGPGFDSMSLALGPIGDAVRMREATADEIRVDGDATIPTAWEKNAVGAVIDQLRIHTGVGTPVRIDLAKGVPPGSGLGSSASSCAAAALAFAKAFGPVDRAALFEAAVAGEARVSGAHRDDVGAALFGGLTLVDPCAWDARSLPPPPSLRLAVVRPHVVLETRRMRTVLPKDVSLDAAVENLSATARLVAAFLAGDVRSVGQAFTDRIATPHRSPLVPGFAAARAAALVAGAHGFGLSGSGPAMCAIVEGDADARTVAGAMRDALTRDGIEASAFVGIPEGVRDVASLVR